MPRVMTCGCGAKVGLPEGSASRCLRCPQCKAGIALASDGAVLPAAPLPAGKPPATCPICQSRIAGEEPVVACPACREIHHRDCWAEVGGCGSYGCVHAPALEKGAPASAPLSAWGDTKTCPVCAESIKAIAVKCRYCGTEFGTVDPLSLADIHQRGRRSDRLQSLRKSVVTLFVISLLGCPAPLTAIVALVMLLPQWALVRKAGPVYLVMAYSTIVLSVLYSVLMLLFALYGGL